MKLNTWESRLNRSRWTDCAATLNTEAQSSMFPIERSPMECLQLQGAGGLQPLGSAGVWRGFLKGAVGGSVKGGGVGGQHVTACFLAGSMRLRLGGGLRRLLVLVLLGGAGVGRRSCFRNRLRGCRRLIAAVVLWERESLMTGLYVGAFNGIKLWWHHQAIIYTYVKHCRCIVVCSCSHLYWYWIVGVSGESLSWRTEAGVGEHVLGGIVQDVGWRCGARSRLWSWLLLQEHGN